MKKTASQTVCDHHLESTSLERQSPSVIRGDKEASINGSLVLLPHNQVNSERKIEMREFESIIRRTFEVAVSGSYVQEVLTELPVKSIYVVDERSSMKEG